MDYNIIMINAYYDTENELVGALICLGRSSSTKSTSHTVLGPLTMETLSSPLEALADSHLPSSAFLAPCDINIYAYNNLGVESWISQFLFERTVVEGQSFFSIQLCLTSKQVDYTKNILVNNTNYKTLKNVTTYFDEFMRNTENRTVILCNDAGIACVTHFDISECFSENDYKLWCLDLYDCECDRIEIHAFTESAFRCGNYLAFSRRCSPLHKFEFSAEVPSPMLVGIETNPGPAKIIFLYFSILLGSPSVVVYLSLLNTGNYYVRAFLVWHFFHVLSCLLAVQFLVSYGFLDIKLQSYESTFAIEDDSSLAIVAFPPQIPLVGIEPNPGPEDFLLLAYLRNIDKLQDPVSTRKVSCKPSISKSDMRKLRNKEKQRDRVVERARVLKRGNMVPEGLFDVGIDQPSRDFLNTLIDRFSAGLLGPQVTVKHEIPVIDKLGEILKYLKSLARKVLDPIIGICKLLASLIGGGLRSFMAMFISDMGYDDSMPDVTMEPEMDIPWSVLGLSVYFTHMSQYVDKSSWMSFVRELRDIKVSAAAAKDSFGVLHAIANEVAKFVCDMLGWENPLERETNPTILAIQSEARDLVKLYTEEGRDDFSFSNRVLTLQSSIEDYLYDKRRILDARVKEKLQYLLRKFQPISDYVVRNLNPSNGPRIEPLAVLISGPTGVGKSTITLPFLLALMNNVIDDHLRPEFKRSHNDFIFYRRSNNEFWDGYKMRNFVIVYDDFAQQRDVIGHPNGDAFEIVQLKNCAPMHLHFAALEDKQRNYAHPKVIYATSNLQQIHFDSLVCSEAVIRRFDLAYLQVPKIEFCIQGTEFDFWRRRMDMKKVRDKFPYCPDDPNSFASLDIVEFVPWDFSNGTRAIGPILDFHQFIRKAIDKFTDLQGRGTNMLRFLDQMKEYSIRPEMDDGGSDSEDLEEEFAQAVDVLPERTIGSILEQMRDWCEEVWRDKRVKYFPPDVSTLPSDAANFFLKFGVALSAVYLGYKGIQRLSNALFPSTFHQESTDSKKVVNMSKKNFSTKTTKGSRIRGQRQNKAVARAQILVPESGIDVQPYLKVLKRNMYRVRFGEREFGWCLFIGGPVFCMPLHFDKCIMEMVPDDQESAMVEFLLPESGRVAFVIDIFNDVDLVEIGDSLKEHVVDIIWYKIRDNLVRDHANIVGMFPPESELPFGSQFDSVMVSKRSDAIIFQYPTVSLDSDFSYEWCGHKLRSRGLKYNVNTEKGDCGAPLITTDKRFKRPYIVGFHTAGSSSWIGRKTCCGVQITNEDVTTALSYFYDDEGAVGDAKMSVDIIEEIPVMDIEAGIDGFVTLSKARQPPMPTKSKIVPSRLSLHLWEPLTKPCFLHKFKNSLGLMVDPASSARCNYSHDQIYVNLDILEEIYPHVATMIVKRHHPQPWAPRVYSFDEAIMGIDGVDYVEAINRATSPGYPFCFETKVGGKKYWFGDADRVDLNNINAKSLRSKVEEVLDKAARGIRSHHVYVDYLKDERKPVEKVDAGKTRQFMACPLDYLICMKMYFGDFVRHVTTNRIHNGCAVGINVYEEWNDLSKFLLFTDDTYLTAGDYSKFDARILVPFSLCVLRIVESFYVDSSPRDRCIRRILFHEIINSLHLCEGKIYQFYGGNPSGNPITAILNSIVNLLKMYYVGLRSERCSARLENREPRKFADILSGTRIVTYGDDILISYALGLHSIWKQSNLEVAVPKYVGLTYTNETKTDETAEFRRLQDVTFLKRGFRKEGIDWLCPLDITVVKETLLWCKNTTTLEDLKLHVESALSELSLHGKKVFENYAPRIVNAAIKEYQFVPENSTYSAALVSACGLSNY